MNYNQRKETVNTIISNKRHDSNENKLIVIEQMIMETRIYYDANEGNLAHKIR
jgi:hypothetical protein